MAADAARVVKTTQKPVKTRGRNRFMGCPTKPLKQSAGAGIVEAQSPMLESEEISGMA